MADPVGIDPVPFQEAIDFSKQRNVVLPSTYYSAGQEAARTEAFTVSNLTSLRQIDSVLSLLDEALREGLTLAQFQERVADEGIETSDAHMETVFRTAVQTAYNQGRTTQQVANASNRPFLMYDAINDSRTRPAHRAMDGYIAPVNDPIWRLWTPPCGYNCRCSLISLTERQARARGYTGSTPAPAVTPDVGWTYDKRSRPSAEQAVNQTLADVKSQQPPVIQRAAGKALLKRP